MVKMQTFCVKWFSNINVHSQRFGLVQHLDLHLPKVSNGTDKNCNFCVLY